MLRMRRRGHGEHRIVGRDGLLDHLAKRSERTRSSRRGGPAPSPAHSGTGERGSRRRCPPRSEVLPRQPPPPRRVRQAMRHGHPVEGDVCANHQESPMLPRKFRRLGEASVCQLHGRRVGEAPHAVSARATSAGSPSSRAVARVCSASSRPIGQPAESTGAALCPTEARTRAADASAPSWSLIGKRGARASSVLPARAPASSQSGCSDDANASASSVSEVSRLQPKAARRLSISASAWSMRCW